MRYNSCEGDDQVTWNCWNALERMCDIFAAQAWPETYLPHYDVWVRRICGWCWKEVRYHGRGRPGRGDKVPSYLQSVLAVRPWRAISYGIRNVSAIGSTESVVRDGGRLWTDVMGWSNRIACFRICAIWSMTLFPHKSLYYCMHNRWPLGFP